MSDLAIKTTSTMEDRIKSELTAKMPGKPGPEVETLYRLRFKKGRTPVQELFFKHAKNQADAEKHAKIFCANWKYRCIWVEEFLTDIFAVPVEFDDNGDPIKEKVV